MPFETLLKMSGTVSVYQRNLQVLATEMYKVKNDINPATVTEIFQKKCPKYDFRRNNTFRTKRVNSVYNSSKTISVLRPKIWELVPSEIKNSDTLVSFMWKIKTWIPNNCPCRLCKVYIANVQFV